MKNKTCKFWYKKQQIFLLFGTREKPRAGSLLDTQPVVFVSSFSVNVLSERTNTLSALASYPSQPVGSSLPLRCCQVLVRLLGYEYQKKWWPGLPKETMFVGEPLSLLRNRSFDVVCTSRSFTSKFQLNVSNCVFHRKSNAKIFLFTNIYSNTLVNSSPHLPVYCMGRWVWLHCFFFKWAY
jgi:hypothetical protein